MVNKASAVFLATVCGLISFMLLAGEKPRMSDEMRNAFASVDLPAENGYTGGAYLPWEPMEFTYKAYDGEISLDSPTFKAEKGKCPVRPEIYQDLSENEIRKLAETDPAAMFRMYIFEYNADNFDKAKKYLKKAADTGHILSNIHLLIFFTDKSCERTEKLKKYLEITPLAALGLDFSEDEMLALMKKGAYPHVTTSLLLTVYALELLNSGKIAPDNPLYKDYVCEVYYRGCLDFDGKNLLGIKCSTQ